jgi:hypothetical protein
MPPISNHKWIGFGIEAQEAVLGARQRGNSS